MARMKKLLIRIFCALGILLLLSLLALLLALAPGMITTRQYAQFSMSLSELKQSKLKEKVYDAERIVKDDKVYYLVYLEPPKTPFAPNYVVVYDEHGRMVTIDTGRDLAFLTDWLSTEGEKVDLMAIQTGHDP